MPPRWLLAGLSLFLLSAAVAAVVAPQPEVAWPRWLGIGLAALLAAGVSMLPGRWARQACAIVACLSAPVMIGGMTTLYGEYWSRNTLGGIAAMVLPFAAAALIRPPGGRGWRWAAGAATVLLSLLLARSGSRGAMLGLLIAISIGVTWWVSRRWGSRRMPFFAALVGGGMVAVALALLAFWPRVVPLIDNVDVGGSDMGRLSIWRDTAYLVAEAPVTGWGGGAFEGAYARYARLIRVPLYSYAHQLYLGIAFEQGVGGLVVWLGLWAAALVAVLRAEMRAGSVDVYRLAALVSTLTLGVHGLVDDPVYMSGALPFLFLWAGLAALLSRDGLSDALRPSLPSKRLLWTTMMAAVLGVLVIIVERDPVIAVWHTNRAANLLASQELAAWPTVLPARELAPIWAELDAATLRVPDQAAPRFLRGMLALEADDFSRARSELEIAYMQAPDSRATVKALGYARLWSGDVSGAATLLAALPEIRDELYAYDAYWKSQGQESLSEQARALADRLSP